MEIVDEGLSLLLGGGMVMAIESTWFARSTDNVTIEDVSPYVATLIWETPKWFHVLTGTLATGCCLLDLLLERIGR
jgi:hypothetical protein